MTTDDKTLYQVVPRDRGGVGAARVHAAGEEGEGLNPVAAE
jgi:hypothetical protein